MAGRADEAQAHMAAADQALKPSWMSLKFQPDHLTASMEYASAANKFRALNMLPDAVHAWLRSAQCKEAINDPFAAGRAYESAGQISEGCDAVGGPEAAVRYWLKAKHCFRLSGKSEIAAKLLTKLAALAEKQHDVAQAKEFYEETIDVHLEEGKDYNLGEVFKQYTGFLVRSGLYEDALKTIDQHITLLLRQGHAPFVHKELLGKVVLLLCVGDTVRADDALAPEKNVDGWFQSKECEAGHGIVAAFREFDAEGAAKVLKEPPFASLHIEIARLARQLRVPGAPASAAGGAGGGGEGDAGGGAVDPAQQEQDLAELLM
eukprot:TRINITY_DN72844_c0_g1_i1.p1 TRINITY_DN72844_c0_g1~~TRINITY_DN72844_c0_g1_i1.p1  ORF type:complete len:319 (+),score=86.32 TRINITY_DN72844_c0_g1_i1:83-1039(+)